jgi:hypothetical protein
MNAHIYDKYGRTVGRCKLHMNAEQKQEIDDCNELAQITNNIEYQYRGQECFLVSNRACRLAILTDHCISMLEHVRQALDVHDTSGCGRTGGGSKFHVNTHPASVNSDPGLRMSR